jgi:ATP-binding cassette subfamily B protein
MDAVPADRLHLRLRSSVPGRQRWESRHLVGRAGLAARLKALLLGVSGIQSVDVRANTGRILLELHPSEAGDTEPLLRRSLYSALVDEWSGVQGGGASTAGSSTDVPRTDERHPLAELLRRFPLDKKGRYEAPAWSVVNNVVNFLPELGLVGIVNVVNGGNFPWLAAIGARGVRGQVVALGVLTAAAFAGELWVERRRRKAWRKIAREAEHKVRVDAYDHLQQQDMAYIDSHNSANLMNLIWDDTAKVKEFMETGADDMFQRCVTAVIIVLSLASVSPILALTALAPLPVIVGGSRYVQKKTEEPYETVERNESMLNKLLSNNIADLTTIKSFTAEARETERIGEASASVRDSSSRAIETSSGYTDLMRLLISVCFAVSMVIGGFLVAQKKITPAMFTLVLFFVPKLLMRMEGMGQSYDQYKNATAGARNLLGLFDQHPRIVSGDAELDRETASGDVAFDDVTFGYRPDHPVISGFNLVIPERKTVALVGSTGSGKSTIVKLLLRFYEPGAGRVTVGGRDIRDVKLDQLRRSIGFVNQDVVLFDGTIYDNILIGRPDADAEEVIAAARAAEAHEFIVGLPDGYRCGVGERGRMLSGGQRQRISIARAILKDPPILILDEATSAVDNETEAAIQRSIAHVAKDRTTIIIAHRLSTVRNAHCIHVMQDGEIVESGGHDVLLRRGGLYAAMWRVQTGGPLHKAG